MVTSKGWLTRISSLQNWKSWAPTSRLPSSLALSMKKKPSELNYHFWLWLSKMYIRILSQLKKYFTFEVQVMDDKNVRRRFRASNYQSTTRVKPFICTMPMRLDEGWNQIQFNLSDFTRRAYGSNYIETLRVTIHANCRIRRIYFSDRLYSEEELPPEFKLFLPIQKQGPWSYFTGYDFTSKYNIIIKISKVRTSNIITLNLF